MARTINQGVGWQDEGLVPVALIVVSYVWLLFPVSWLSLIGVASMLIGALVAFEMWHGATSRGCDPSRATRFALGLLKLWPLWAMLCRAVVGWLSS